MTPTASTLRWWAITLIDEGQPIGWLVAPGSSVEGAVRGAVAWSGAPAVPDMSAVAMGPFGLVDLEKNFGEVQLCKFQML